MIKRQEALDKIRLLDAAIQLDVRPTDIVGTVGEENVKLSGYGHNKRLYVFGFTIEQIKYLLNK